MGRAFFYLLFAVLFVVDLFGAEEITLDLKQQQGDDESKLWWCQKLFPMKLGETFHSHSTVLEALRQVNSEASESPSLNYVCSYYASGEELGKAFRH